MNTCFGCTNSHLFIYFFCSGFPLTFVAFFFCEAVEGKISLYLPEKTESVIRDRFTAHHGSLQKTEVARTHRQIYNFRKSEDIDICPAF